MNGGVIPDIAIFESLLTNDKQAKLVRSVNIIQTNWGEKNLGMYFFVNKEAHVYTQQLFMTGNTSIPELTQCDVGVK